jgi:hypothetical protein
MNTLIKSILFAGAFLFSNASFALYFDGGLGNASVDFDTITVLPNGDVRSVSVDDSETYIRLGVGDRIGKTPLNWEGGYWDLGDVDGLFGNVKVAMDLNKDTQLFGKAGLYMWDAGQADGNDLFFGGGVTFEKIGPGNLNLELFLMDLDGIDVTTIGGSYTIPLNL